mmetsp:Transcript_39581/g.93983  ORF Transcript_39581/g.93983 Transcript_39581/m.93983 type:complete len:127 (-) Transcript_39581:1375-1755(-)
MLPGGLQVLGTFFFGSEAALQQSNSSLSRLACACVEISSPAIAEDGSSVPECAIPPILFFADSKSKKMSVKVCEPTGSQQPAELKWMSLADSFIPLSCELEGLGWDQRPSSRPFGPGRAAALHPGL